MKSFELDDRLLGLLDEATSAWRAGDVARAAHLSEFAVAHVQTIRGQDSREAADLLMYLGLIAKNNGIYSVAKVFYEESLQIRTKLFEPPSSEVAAILTNLGRLYEQMGEQLRAESLLREAAAMYCEVSGEGDPRYATALNNLGLFLLRAGDLREANQALACALHIRETQGDESPLKLAQALRNLALCNQELGNFTEAEPDYKSALELGRRFGGSGNTFVPLCLASLARFYAGLANYRAALSHFAQAERIYRTLETPDKGELAGFLQNFGVLQHSLGHYSEARRYLSEALAIRQGIPGSRREVASTTLSLAELAHSEKSIAVAESLYANVLGTYEREFGRDHYRCADVHAALAGLSFDLGEHDKALERFEKALRMRVQTLGDSHEDVAKNLDNLAVVYAAAKRPDQAIDAVLRSAKIRDRLLAQVISLASESERTMYLDSLRSNTDILMTLAMAGEVSEASLADAFGYVLRRKGLGLELSAAQQTILRSEDTLDSEGKYQRWVSLSHEIKRLAVNGPDSRGPEVHAERLSELRERRDELERELARKKPALAVLQSPRVSPAAVLSSERLPRDAALVEIVKYRKVSFTADILSGEERIGPSCYGAFVAQVGVTGNLTRVDLGEAEAIDESVQRFRAAVVTNKARGRPFRDIPAEQPERPGDDGAALTRSVFEPLRAHFGGRRRVVVCPDGELTQLPLQVLPTEGRSHVIDKWTISYLNTVSDLVRPEAPAHCEPKPPLVVSAPEYDLGGMEWDAPQRTEEKAGEQSADILRAGFPFKKLDGMRAEGEDVAKRLNVSAVDGELALERTVKERCPPRVLHAATHGFFLEDAEQTSSATPPGLIQGNDRRIHLARLEDPLLRAGLVLAGANTWFRGGELPEEAEDGVLNGQDVAMLDLSETELVVLSACNTGVGEVRSGEGVFGLRSAFKLAGARTLVMSLWKVPDDETRNLMVEFYRQLSEGKPPAEALRFAQLEMKKINASPFFWGAFICEGQNRPIRAFGTWETGPADDRQPGI